jgi:hypothetical protein
MLHNKIRDKKYEGVSAIDPKKAMMYDTKWYIWKGF